MSYTIITELTEEHKKDGFISVYKPIAGWKAIQYWWNKDQGGFWEPWQTGMIGWATEEEAVLDAKTWAEAEELPYLEN